DAVLVRAVRAHADAGAALRYRPRRPPRRWPARQHHRRRDGHHVRRVRTGGARAGGAAGTESLSRPRRVEGAHAAGHGPAVRVGGLHAPLPGRLPAGPQSPLGRRLTAGEMDFVLTLHSHLPYVLHHGRWPHGSDWLCEAAVDTYLPLLEQLQGLALEGTAAPVTIGFTPVLANQLASPTFAQELEAFFDQREAACQEAPASLAATRDSALLPLVEFWQSRFGRLRSLFHSVDSNILAAFRRLQDGGQLEIIGSAATHGYLPLLARDESIRLQLVVGRNEHRRLFGRDPVGCWLPECAYRPRVGRRPGIDEQLASAGFRYFFTDAHLAQAGTPLGTHYEVTLGAERFDAERHDGPSKPTGPPVHSPYRTYRVTPPRAKRSVAALVRDPRSSMQVWSRHHGYPGDEWYLEFHKIRWP